MSDTGLDLIFIAQTKFELFWLYSILETILRWPLMSETIEPGFTDYQISIPTPLV